MAGPMTEHVAGVLLALHRAQLEAAKRRIIADVERHWLHCDDPACLLRALRAAVTEPDHG